MPAGEGERVSKVLFCFVCLIAVATVPVAGQAGARGDSVEVTARVFDSGTKMALAGAVIEISGAVNRYVTDVNGVARLRAAVGNYTLTVRRGGYETLTGEFAVQRPGDFALELTRAELEDPNAPARLLVTAVDAETGRAVAGAAVTLLGAGRGGPRITNVEGRAEFDGLLSRLAQVTVQIIGYSTRSEPVALHPGRTTNLEVLMTVEAVPLRPLNVTVRSRFLESQGVYGRIDRGLPNGVLTRAMLERQASPRIGDTFSRVPGLEVRRVGTGDGMPFRSVLYARNCPLAVFMDGVEWNPDIVGSVDIDRIPPHWVEMVEVYWGPQLPAEYARDGNVCGAALIWTRRRAGS